jgi:hypothetical protein
MSTIRTIRQLAVAAALISAYVGQAQVTVATNNASSGDYVGCDNTSPFPLEIRQNDNEPIEFFTDNAFRMRLNEGLPSQIINGFSSLDLSGNLGVGNFTGPVYSRAASRFHSESNSSTDDGFRPMIGQGFLATRGETLCYTGLLGAVNSGTIWSQVTGSAGTPGSFRFIYTGGNGGTTEQAETTAGLELARFEPSSSLNEGFFGIGDWATAGLTPDERLDIVDRTIRLRNFMATPPVGTLDYESTVLENVLVVDPTDGRVYWRNMPASGWGGGGGSACDWDVTAAADVVTAYSGTPSPGCPGDVDLVGIGTSLPNAKLDVVKYINNAGTWDKGIAIKQGTSSTQNAGVFSDVNGVGQLNVGVESKAINAGRVYGVRGFGAQSVFKVGVYGEALRNNCSDFAAALYGNSAMVNPTCGPGWAAYLVGAGFISNGPWVPSDQALKLNIQPLGSALSTIGLLNPTTFTFDQATYPQLSLPSGVQYGLMAQDLEQVLPSLVMDVTHPARIDTLGNVLSPAVDSKVVNYTPLISVLVAGMQEQQAMITQQNARIDALELQVAQCCATVPADNRGMAQTMSNGSLETDLRIIPNPVAANTQLRYTLATGGRVRLEVTDNSGRLVEVLETATRTAGSFTYEWNTTQLATGTYYCALYLNDERLVQKAVKLNER